MLCLSWQNIYTHITQKCGVHLLCCPLTSSCQFKVVCDHLACATSTRRVTHYTPIYLTPNSLSYESTVFTAVSSEGKHRCRSRRK